MRMGWGKLRGALLRRVATSALMARTLWRMLWHLCGELGAWGDLTCRSYHTGAVFSKPGRWKPDGVVQPEIVVVNQSHSLQDRSQELSYKKKMSLQRIAAHKTKGQAEWMRALQQQAHPHIQPCVAGALCL